MTKFMNIGVDQNVEFEGHKGWMWITHDRVTWQFIAGDWLNTHKEKIFKHVGEDRRRVVIQAGGNCGMYPRLLTDYFERVYTAEPDPANFYCLSNNCPYDNVIKLNAAFGDKNQLIRIKVRTLQNVGMHQVETGEGAYIPMLKIDQLAVDACDFLWLDVEEHEGKALIGAMETITKYKPVIMLENFIEDEHMKLLGPLGYKVAETSHMDTILVADNSKDS